MKAQMRYERRRTRLLPGLVEQIWEQRSNQSTEWRILPSGRVELIFRLGPAFTLRRARRLGPDPDAVREFCFLSGLHTSPLDLHFSSLHVFGVQLHPAAVLPILGIPCSEIRDGAVEGRLLLNDLDRIEDRLRGEPDFESRADWIEGELMRRLLRGKDLHAANRMLELWDAARRSPTTRTRDLVQRLGYSRSHAHRLFEDWLGQSVGGALRLERFVRSLGLLHEDSLTLSAVAHRVGYYDQAHFIRSFREFAGMTPGEYRSRRGFSPGQLAI